MLEDLPAIPAQQPLLFAKVRNVDPRRMVAIAQLLDPLRFLVHRDAATGTVHFTSRGSRAGAS
jgi:hypothetical protein